MNHVIPRKRYGFHFFCIFKKHDFETWKSKLSDYLNSEIHERRILTLKIINALDFEFKKTSRVVFWKNFTTCHNSIDKFKIVSEFEMKYFHWILKSIFNLSPPLVHFTTFSSLSPWTVTVHKLCVKRKVAFTIQAEVPELVSIRILTFDWAVWSTFVPCINFL